MELIGNVEGKNVVLVDDMVDTAGTLTKAADLMMERGAKSVRAICTHPLLSGKAYERIEKSQLKELIVSDSIPSKKNSNKIKINNRLAHNIKNDIFKIPKSDIFQNFIISKNLTYLTR